MTIEIRWQVTEGFSTSLQLHINYRLPGQVLWKSLVDERAEEKAYLWHAPVDLPYYRMTEDQRVLMLKKIIDIHYGGSMEEYVKAVAAKELEDLIENIPIQDEAVAFRNRITTFGWKRTTVTVKEGSSK